MTANTMVWIYHFSLLAVLECYQMVRMALSSFVSHGMPLEHMTQKPRLVEGKLVDTASHSVQKFTPAQFLQSIVAFRQVEGESAEGRAGGRRSEPCQELESPSFISCVEIDPCVG